MGVYPEAKIILTVRDPAKWHRSIMTTFYRAQREFVVRFMRIVPALQQFLLGMEKAIWEDVFQSKLEDKDHAIAVFKGHLE